MSEQTVERNKLDLNKLNKRITRIVSTQEALKDITPIEWTDDVLEEGRQAVITKAEKDCENKCVKLEISYL